MQAGEDIHYITSGAGSDVRSDEFAGIFAPPAHAASGEAPAGRRRRRRRLRSTSVAPDLVYAANEQGFTAVTVSKDKMTVQFYVASRTSPAHTVVITNPTD